MGTERKLPDCPTLTVIHGFCIKQIFFLISFFPFFQSTFPKRPQIPGGCVSVKLIFRRNEYIYPSRTQIGRNGCLTLHIGAAGIPCFDTALPGLPGNAQRFRKFLLHSPGSLLWQFQINYHDRKSVFSLLFTDITNQKNNDDDGSYGCPDRRSVIRSNILSFLCQRQSGPFLINHIPVPVSLGTFSLLHRFLPFYVNVFKFLLKFV